MDCLNRCKSAGSEMIGVSANDSAKFELETASEVAETMDDLARAVSSAFTALFFLLPLVVRLRS